MLNKMFGTILFLLAFQSFCWGAAKVPVYTQKDFAKQMLQQFSWSDGLPKEPADRDYLLILGGKRTFRYEAENIFNEQTDRVTVRDFQLFGPFTGKGWIMGVTDTTYSTFTLFVPIAGEYDLKAVIKGDGFVWKVGEKEYLADSKSSNFQETSVAKVKLNAGNVIVKLTIPPNGAIDSFSITAPDHTPIKPFSGWRFKDTLTAVRLAETAVSMTNRFSQLPDAPQVSAPAPIAVFEKVPDLKNAEAVTDSFLGPFSSAKWVRADFRGTTLQIPLKVSEAGYYTLILNAMGGELTGKINENEFKIVSKPYLDKVNIGIYRLEAGDNMMTINLPPVGGIDTVEFIRKSLAPADVLRLADVRGPADRLIYSEEATSFLKGILGSFSIRK